MARPELSVLVPSIKESIWKEEFYESLKGSCSLNENELEVIFVGPSFSSPKLEKHKNIKYIRDFGSPMRSQQIALINASGELCYWTTDDGVFLDETVDRALHQFYTIKDDKKAVSCSYYEGINRNKEDSGSNDPIHESEKNWICNTHPGLHPLKLPDHYKLIHQGIIRTNYIKSLGGFDCRYETVGGGLIDICVRLQIDKCTIHITDKPVMKFHWCPGETEDHGPVERRHNEHDYPLYLKEIPLLLKENVAIPLDNWMDSPPVWNARFTN